MIENVFKIMVAIIIGYVVGLFSGAFLGIVIGLVPSLFFHDIVYANQTLMSIFLSLFLGGLLGAFAIQLGNKMFGTRDKSFIGALAGAMIGLIVVVFVSGVIHISNSEASNQAFHFKPMLYTCFIGGDIGTIMFPIFNVARVIRDYRKEKNYKKRENERQNELSFYKSKNSLDGKK